ncbi:MAG TPA: DUF4384 domain-containing protein [Pyrinomonadaceae bacterium]|jgi:hypothetical protein|nr:DUF4384 domain-containing protein [Pyrinomonadaceae bacterium]
MSFKLSNAFALLFLFVSASALPLAQEAQPRQDEQKVIDDFVQTRGVIFEDSRKKKAATTKAPARPQQGRKNPPASARKQGTKPADATTAAAKPGAEVRGSEEADGTTASKASADGAVKPIGLGYTLFMNDEAANPVVVEASREFKAGDQIRVQLESNADGFLYIFHTEDGRDPQMLYPHAALEAGRNWVAAHSRQFFPSDLTYGFIFDDRPATERLYFVLSRRPLRGVPTAEDLTAFCGGAREDCYWKPGAAEWEKIKAGAAGVRAVEARNTQLATSRAASPLAGTRGLKLQKGEPAPAFVRMNERADADILVTTLDLVHK